MGTKHSNQSPLGSDFSEDPDDIDQPGAEDEGDVNRSALNDAKMWQHLPRLIIAVRTKWHGYRLDPNHDRIDALRDEVQLLVYWLSRQIVKSSRVSYVDTGPRGGESGNLRRTAKMGTFGGAQTTDLQHELWTNVLDSKTVTDLVSAAKDDIVTYLIRILIHKKIDRYRKYQTRKKYDGELAEDVATAMRRSKRPKNDATGRDADHTPAADLLLRPEDASMAAARCAEAYQCLEQFSEFLEQEKLNPKLESVAWAVWMSRPLSAKTRGEDTSENQKITDSALARDLGMPKKTFDLYKSKAAMLVKRFRGQTGW